MADDQEPRFDAPSKEEKQGTSSVLFWGIVLVAFPVAYLLSPFILLGPILLWEDHVPSWVILALEVFWMPIMFYVKAELPGGKEYEMLIMSYRQLFVP